MTSEERAVAEVLARYVRAVDRRDEAGVAALSANDAVAEVTYRPFPRPDHP
ncbi:SnoaL-like domain-containing protein [Actinoplanes sp. TBRC 11911]|nr:SnoaL-like domain-containing protein [Actinoplanes sp. TBRC 11911]